jgi:hypothetical protein
LSGNKPESLEQSVVEYQYSTIAPVGCEEEPEDAPLVVVVVDAAPLVVVVVVVVADDTEVMTSELYSSPSLLLHNCTQSVDVLANINFQTTTAIRFTIGYGQCII